MPRSGRDALATLARLRTWWRARRLPRRVDMAQSTSLTALVGTMAPGGPLDGAVVVGGAVRDALLGRDAADVDLLVPDPEGSARALGDALGGSAFALDHERHHWRVVAAGRVLDLTPPAGGLGADPRDPGVLAADLASRDLTVNAMALLPDGTLVDPTGGRTDLAARIVRITSPRALEADPVRAFRAVRFAAELGATLDPASAAAVAACAEALQDARLPSPSPERVRDELDAMLMTPRAGRAAAALVDLGLLGLALPELVAGRGVAQGPLHHLDVLGHQLEALQRLVAAFPDADLALRYATLLHDVGKPSTRSAENGGRPRFHGHDRAGALITRGALRRLRVPRARVERAAALVRAHMRPLPAGERAARRFVHRLRPLLPDLMRLMVADREAARGPLASEAQRRAYRMALARVVALLEEAPPPPPLVDGDEVMAALGVGAGPVVGRALRAVEEARAVGDVADAAEAIAYLRRLHAAGGLDAAVDHAVDQAVDEAGRR